MLAQSESGDRMRVGLCIVGSGVFGLAMIMAQVAPVRAQTDDERARTHFEAGRSYYEQAQYEDAAREFQESFDLSGRPELLLNISQARERALQYDDAIGAARHYLELIPKAPDRKTIEDRIVSLQELKRRFEDGGPAPLAPPGDTLSPTPLGDNGTPGTTKATKPGETTAPETAPVPATAPPTAAGAETQPGPDLSRGPSSEPESKFTIPAIVMMGTGGAALVGALVTGLVAHADYNSLERQCNGNICPASAEDELDEGKTLSVVSTVLTIVGVVAAGTGAALLIIGAQANESHESKAAPPHAGPLSVGPGLTPLSVSGKLSF
jgi:tetratricopeptide (TPR) repeat protein